MADIRNFGQIWTRQVKKIECCWQALKFHFSFSMGAEGYILTDPSLPVIYTL